MNRAGTIDFNEFLEMMTSEVIRHQMSEPEKSGRTSTANWKSVRHAVQQHLQDSRWDTSASIHAGQLLPRTALPRFTLGIGFLHAMISYRVATEGESGNNLSFELYKKIRELSLADENLKIPQYAWGTWPLFARQPAGFKPSQAKVYLDRECLHDGEDWEVGFVQGLSSSIVMVCLLSFNEHGRGSLGDLTTLRPEEGKDRVDNVLLELIIGKELQTLGEHSAICAILPILLGPQRKDSSFEQFPFGKLGLLSQEPSVMTNNRAASILAMLGVGDKQIQAMQARSVRQHVDLILKNQGVQASTYANQDELVLESARRCLMVIKKEVFNIRTNPKRFANNRPHGQEVVDWLRGELLSAYIPIFLHHGLDTLLSVKDLSREQVSRLTNEFRDIYTVACNKESVAWSTFGPSAVVDTDEQVGTMQSELHLWRAIRTLDRDSRARTMTERLEWFEDSFDFDSYNLKKKQSSPIHAVWARNAFERYMELQTMFIILSVLLLLNLVEMQKNMATCYDFCQENFIHRMETFLALLWLANVRCLGYNGTTITRDFAIILSAATVRKCCALRMVYGQPGKEEDAILLAAHIVEGVVAVIHVKYRQEYSGIGRVPFLLLDVLLASKLGASWWGVLFTLIIIILAFIQCFWYSLHRLIFVRKATVEVTRFREAWVECSENSEVVTELTQLSKGITVCLVQQCEEALQMLPWYRKVQAYLEQRVDRWSLLCKGKVRQTSTDLDLLMANAGVINEKFLDLVSEMGVSGYSVNRNPGLEFVAGPVKQPMRTLQKVVRRYRRDVGCLTDLVRCTVIADSLENVKDFLQLLYSRSMVGLDTSEEGKGLRQRLGQQLDTDDEIFRITALENRFDPSYDEELSWGYRDLALNVEVGWIISSGMVSFQKVCDWRRLNCITHICEIQVRTRAIHELAVLRHNEYRTRRNGLSM
jgi:hypothetical protein